MKKQQGTHISEWKGDLQLQLHCEDKISTLRFFKYSICVCAEPHVEAVKLLMLQTGCQTLPSPSMRTTHISEQALSAFPLRQHKLLNISNQLRQLSRRTFVRFITTHVEMMIPSLHLPSNNISKANSRLALVKTFGGKLLKEELMGAKEKQL